MFDLRHLEHAIAIADHGGFHKAARALGISQPAVSRSLQALEESLGVRLFDRSRSSVAQTVFGKVLIERGRALLQDHQAIAREIALLQGLELGALEIGLGAYPAALVGRAALSRLLASRPALQLRVQITSWRQVTAAVLDERCELGLAELSAAKTESGLHVERVMTREGYFLCDSDHELLRRGRLELTDLLAYPWACTPLPGRLGQILPESLGRAGRWEGGRFLPALCLEVVSDIPILVEGTDILGVVALSMAEDQLKSGRLAVVPYRPHWLRLNAGFITLRGRTLSPAATEFMNLVRTVEAAQESREADLVARYVR